MMPSFNSFLCGKGWHLIEIFNKLNHVNAGLTAGRTLSFVFFVTGIPDFENFTYIEFPTKPSTLDVICPSNEIKNVLFLLYYKLNYTRRSAFGKIDYILFVNLLNFFPNRSPIIDRYLILGDSKIVWFLPVQRYFFFCDTTDCETCCWTGRSYLDNKRVQFLWCYSARTEIDRTLRYNYVVQICNFWYASRAACK
jgi:hypothetical protein